MRTKKIASLLLNIALFGALAWFVCFVYAIQTEEQINQAIKYACIGTAFALPVLVFLEWLDV